MTPRPTSVSTELQLRLVVPGAASLPVRAGLRYDVADPYAVQVSFHTGNGTEGEIVEWTFARQLLTDGVSAPVGEGDVQVWPSASAGLPVVCLSLSSPSGKALFEVPLPELVDFLGQTYAAVPTGSEGEHVDVEAELALLLWAEPET
jgi:hypothetical protein